MDRIIAIQEARGELDYENKKREFVNYVVEGFQTFAELPYSYKKWPYND